MPTRRVFLFSLKARDSPTRRACARRQHQPAFTGLMRVHSLMFRGLLQLSEDTLPTLGETLRMKELQTCLTLDPPQNT